MRRALEIVAAVVAALVIFAVTTIGALIGLNAECSSDCPRSDAYRASLLAFPPTVALLLVVGAVWSILRRRLRPLVLAEAAAIALAVVIDAALQGPDAGTVVLGGLAVGTAVAAARR